MPNRFIRSARQRFGTFSTFPTISPHPRRPVGAMHRAMPVSADRAAPAGPAHPREKPASRRGRAKSRETWTLRWRELDSNLRFRARVVSVLLLRDQMLLASAWIPPSLWGATREIGLYAATASAPLVLKRADRPWAHTVIEKPVTAVVFRAPPVGFEMRLEPTTADGAFR